MPLQPLVVLNALSMLLLIGVPQSLAMEEDELPLSPPDAFSIAVAINSSHLLQTDYFGAGFASLSIEYYGLLNFIGHSNESLNTGAVNAIETLRSFSGAPLQIRVGGNSEDTSWWNPSKQKPRPPNVTFDIDENFLYTLQAFCQLTGVHFVLGFNLQAYRYSEYKDIGSSYAEAIAATIGWDCIDSIEIGNEVDLYGGNGFRNRSYSFSDYYAEFTAYYEDLAATGALPARPLIQCGVFCSSFISDLQTLIGKSHQICADYSVHFYECSTCHGHVVTVADLLTPSSGVAQANRTRADALYAQSLNRSVVWGETNSASCGGAKNVSDVFASALWGLDWLLNAASADSPRINFHGPGIYGPIADDSSGAHAFPRPLYYALLAFSMATGSKAKLFSPTLTYSFEADVKVWAVKSFSNNTASLVVVHKDLTHLDTTLVTLSVPAAEGYSLDAEAVRLTAPSVYSQVSPDPADRIELSGLYFDGSPDALPRGRLSPESVRGIKNGALAEYSFDVKPLSAVVLTLHK